MYRLLIVDDEAGHRAGLIGQLRILKPDYLVFEAENGAVALQMMDVMQFDLVLTDIRMPKVDGLTFLERAKAKNRYTRIAILTAYSLFDYAKRSVSLGADDYLLKPIDPTELRQCLDRMEKQLESKMTFDDSDALAENHMYLFLMGELSKENREAARELFDPHKSGAIMYIQPDGAWQSDDVKNMFQYEIRRCLKPLGNAVVFRSPTDRRALTGMVACENTTLLNIPEFLEQKARILQEESNQNIAIGICRYRDTFFSNMEEAYTRARGACMQHFFEPERMIFLAETCDAPDPFSTASLDVSIKGIDSSVCGGNAQQAYALMEEKLRRLCVPGAYPSKIKEVIMYTFMFLLGNLTYPLVQSEKDRILSVINKTVLECRSMPDMLNEINTAFEMIAGAIETSRSNHYEEMFDEVLSYLATNYGQDLSMADVAERFHYHPSYFSTLFKQKVGCTFSDYLSDIRMKEAARLLRESSMYAATVGKKVGYPNAAYFTKAFKKQYGMSPDQYRKRGR